VHDYMHAKVTVADDVVFCGSFNLSHSGEQNAEDMLEIHNAALAGQLAAFVDEVRACYPAVRIEPREPARRSAQTASPQTGACCDRPGSGPPGLKEPGPGARPPDLALSGSRAHRAGRSELAAMRPRSNRRWRARRRGDLRRLAFPDMPRGQA